jgi:hypothetical protein
MMGIFLTPSLQQCIKPTIPTSEIPTPPNAHQVMGTLSHVSW